MPFTAFSGLKRPKKGRWVGGGSGPGTARPKKYVPFTAFSGPKKTQKKVRIWEVGGEGGVRSGNGPTSEIRASYGVFRPKKKPKKGTYLGGRRAGVRSGTARPPKYVPFTPYLGGRRAGGSSPGTARPPKYVPFTAFSSQKNHKNVRIWEVGGRGGGVRSGNSPRPKKYVPFAAFSSPKGTAPPPKYVPFTAFSGPRYVFGRSAGGGPVGNGPTSEIHALYGVFRPKKTQKRSAGGRGGVRSGNGPT